jgi:hypothetical protein
MKKSSLGNGKIPQKFHRELTDGTSLGIIRTLFQTHVEGRVVEKGHITPVRIYFSGWMWRKPIQGSSELPYTSPGKAESGILPVTPRTR